MRNPLKHGFTLIELLIVISIIGIIAALMITNISGARARARDAKNKSELNSVKNALELYHNVYGMYPPTGNVGNGLVFNACGPAGNTNCATGGANLCSTAAFAAGGADGCQNVFMQYMTRTGNFFFFRYYPCGSGENYRLTVTLENKSDSEIAESQLRCPASAGSCSLTNYNTSVYVVCP